MKPIAKLSYKPIFTNMLLRFRNVLNLYNELPIDIIYLDGLSNPFLFKLKKGFFAEKNHCLLFVIFEIWAKIIFDGIIFRKLTLSKRFNYS